MQDTADPVRAAESAPDPRTITETAAGLRPLARSFQEQTEAERRIPPPLVEQLRQAGMYRLVIPRGLGGLQVDLLDFLRTVELLAEGDGSTGWNIANNAIGQLIALSLPDEGVQEVFEHGPDTIMAGTAVPGGGKGVPVEGGYLVTGRWPFGSGCRESRWMLANFDVIEHGEPRRNPDGSAVLYRGFFRSSEVTVIDTWDMTGMRGTGSHDWSVESVFVPSRRTVRVPARLLTNQWQRWPGTLYAVPVHGLVGPHHSMIATGIARAGIDALKELAGAKVPRGRTGLLREQVQVQEALARAEAILAAGQALRAQAVGDIWRTVAAGHAVSAEQVARSRLGATYSVDCARQAMDLVYRAGGTTSSQRSQPLARCWRDLHVVAQAASVAPEWYALVGRTLLGLDGGPRLA